MAIYPNLIVHKLFQSQRQKTCRKQKRQRRHISSSHVTCRLSRVPSWDKAEGGGGKKKNYKPFFLRHLYAQSRRQTCKRVRVWRHIFGPGSKMRSRCLGCEGPSFICEARLKQNRRTRKTAWCDVIRGDYLVFWLGFRFRLDSKELTANL